MKPISISRTGARTPRLRSLLPRPYGSYEGAVDGYPATVDLGIVIYSNGIGGDELLELYMTLELSPALDEVLDFILPDRRSGVDAKRWFTRRASA